MSAATLDRPKALGPDGSRSDAAPATAFMLAAEGNVNFQPTTDGKSAAVEMLARTGNAIPHWYWGSIVHDFAGMRHRPSIALDYNHNTEDPIGYVDVFDVRGGDLYLGGSIESIVPGDEADKLMQRRNRKIPYQASIFFDPETMVVEELEAGMFATVNGRQVEGPAIIAREWDLRGVAITPHGKDIGTEAKFSNASTGAFSLNWSDKHMSKKSKFATSSEVSSEIRRLQDDGMTLEEIASRVDRSVSTIGQILNGEIKNPPDELLDTLKGLSMRSKEKAKAALSEDQNPDEKKADSKLDETATETTTENRAVNESAATVDTAELSVTPDDLDAARKMVGLFSDHFGQADGAAYFAEGLNMTQAALKHIGKLNERLATVEAERDKARQQLSAARLSIGEDEPVELGANKDQGNNKTFAGLFRQAGSDAGKS